MRKEDFIVYDGEQFTIEWYFNERGHSSAMEYYESLDRLRKDKIFHLIQVLGDRGKIFNIEKFRYEGDQIFAIKPVPDRFLCFFFDGAKVIVTNAYEKKSQKMPQREKNRALEAKADYVKRCERGAYYGKDKKR